MAIPDLEDSGFLPAGRHAATPAEVREAFVGDAPDDAARAQLFKWWRVHRAALDLMITVESQWLGGSFVSAKPTPGDIDLCTILNGPAFESLSEPAQALVGSLVAGVKSRCFWNCDSYAVWWYPPGTPGHEQFKAAIAYWDRQWGHARPDPATGTTVERGYLEVWE